MLQVVQLVELHGTYCGKKNAAAIITIRVHGAATCPLREVKI